MQVYTGGMDHISLANWKKKSCLMICLAGCNFKCPYCNTPNMLDFKEEFLTDILELKRQINSLSYNVETILFSGGEPCLQRQALLNLARHCKQIGLDIGLDTNGSKPFSILSLIRENMLDFIEIDLKSPLNPDIFEKVTRSKTFFKQTNQIIEDFNNTLNILKNNQDKIQIIFKTTIVPNLIDNENQLFEMAEIIKNINSTWILQRFEQKNVLKSFDNIDLEYLVYLKDKIKRKYPNISIELY